MGALAVLAGRPNAGKSSLFNALLGVERAIVTEIPGTTRDAIEATVELGSFPFRLIDTAGLRASDDQVERLGVEVAERYAGAADLMLYCVDGTAGLTPEDREAYVDTRIHEQIRVRNEELFPKAIAEYRESWGWLDLLVGVWLTGSVDGRTFRLGGDITLR